MKYNHISYTFSRKSFVYNYLKLRVLNMLAHAFENINGYNNY
uniref:Uncharacterized protein n=1 Tax=Manihot esculenta TaxID=3983 RepID=A0A2C9VWN2_MANES